MGTHRVILSALLITLAGSVRAQNVIAAPSSGGMIDVMRETYDAADEQTRFESVSWIRSRTTPAAFQVLRRASRDPSPAIAFEGLMGLAEIAPEYELDSYQMRHLPGEARAELVRRASEQGLIGLPTLRSIAMDSSAEPIERAEALIAMRATGERTKPALWLPMIGATDEHVRLLAALAIVTDAPRVRSVAIAQDHATSIIRKSVRDAADGRISTVISTLTDARRAPTDATADWCLALVGACAKGNKPEHRLVVEEALRTALIAAPERAQNHWHRLCESSHPDDAVKLASWALDAALSLSAHNEPVPGWLADLPHRTEPDSTEFVSSVSRAIEALSANRPAGPAIVDVAMTGGPAARRLCTEAILGLNEHDRAPVIVSLIDRAGNATFESEHVMALARDLAAIDPISAQVAIGRANPESVVARCLVLSGVWSPSCREGSSLGLLRSLWLAERETEGARSIERSALAERLELITDSPDAFSGAIRAEAAWLALVLRDQTSEAMAYLPVLSPVYDGDLSLELEQADSLMQWAQMPYP
ncbi:MAG: hypothetical protein KDA31_14390 [Phycisphaerales bacterium]|nr:hypothetical protein [Phycisphaerales bacterium]MCB9835440.1 hypothetical protein [Phycisphaera sp.]